MVKIRGIFVKEIDHSFSNLHKMVREVAKAAIIFFIFSSQSLPNNNYKIK